MNYKKYFVTGIGTDVGKSIVSAILVESMQADYWKPIQSGDIENSDTIKVKSLISNNISKFHKEEYSLNTAVSPHLSAKIDGIEIDLDSFKLPETNNHLIVEGAGGLLVPISNHFTVVDIIKKLNIEVIIISKNYLGSINHTLLTIESLKQRNINIKGIIFNGVPNKESESIIQKLTNINILGKINEEETINKETILKYKNDFSFLSE